jgi:uncharacterized membrane protein YkoI
MDDEERCPPYPNQKEFLMMQLNGKQSHQQVFYRWILAGTMGLGLAVAIPSYGQAGRDASERARVRERAARDAAARDDVEEVVKFSALPKQAQEAVDEQRKGREITSVHRVMRDGREFYRVGFAVKNGGERSIRVSPRGSLLSIEDVRQADVAAYREDPARYYRDTEQYQTARERYYARQTERVTATVANPQKVEWDQIPGAVRTTLLREAAGEKPNYIIAYRDSDHVIYQTNIDDGRGKVHMVQVLPDGSIFNEGEFTNAGQKIAADWKPRTIGYQDLPARVKDAVDREAPTGRVPHVDVAMRRGQNVYTVEIDNRDGTRFLTLNEDGKVLGDVSERFDTATNDRSRTRIDRGQ